MGRAAKYGFIMVMISTIIFAALLFALSFGRQYGVKIYPRYIIPFSTLAPIFYASLIGRGLIRNKKQPLSKRETLTFCLISIVGIAISSFATEAGMFYGFLHESEGLAYSEILFSPLNKRYSVTAVFGMSFVVSATVVAAFVTLLRIPAVINIRLRLAKADQHEQYKQDT